MDHSTATDTAPNEPAPAARSTHAFPVPNRPAESVDESATPAAAPAPAPEPLPQASPAAPIPAADAPEAPAPGAGLAPAASAPATARPSEPAPVPPTAATGATPPPGRSASGVRGLFSTPVTLGPVVVVALVTLAFIGLLFAMLHVRVGEVDATVRAGLEQTQKDVSADVQAVNKQLDTIQSNLTSMQARLPSAATQRRMETMAASITAIEKQINEWAAQEEATSGDEGAQKSGTAQQ